MTRTRRLHLGLILFMSMLLAVGCNKKETSSSSPGPPPGPSPAPGTVAWIPETGPHAAGGTVFKANCARCHVPAGSKKMMGPELNTVARDPDHTPEWFAEYVRNPKSKKPDSRMPPFQGKISDDDFKALVEFLATLK
jgi:mono/diheme cytochrome c family protein